MSETGYLESHLKKLAIFHSSKRYSLLQEYMNSSWFDVGTARDIVLEGLDKTGALLVFDDYHKLKDPRITEMIKYFLDKMQKIRIIIISRKRPSLRLVHPKIKVYHLGDCLAGNL